PRHGVRFLPTAHRRESPGSPAPELSIGPEDTDDDRPHPDEQNGPTPSRPGEPTRHEHLAKAAKTTRFPPPHPEAGRPLNRSTKLSTVRGKESTPHPTDRPAGGAAARPSAPESLSRT